MMYFCFVFPLIHRRQVSKTKAEAQKDGVKVPLTLQDYCIQHKAQTPSHSSQDLTDFYEDDDYADDGDYEEEEEDGCYFDDEDDSGNGES